MLILVLLSSVVVRDSKKREIQLFRKLMVNFFLHLWHILKRGGKKRARKTAESNLHSKWFATLLQLTHLLSLLLFVLP